MYGVPLTALFVTRHILTPPSCQKDDPLPPISTKPSIKETSDNTTRIHLEPSIYASLYHIPPQPPVPSFPARYSLRRHPCPSSSCLGMNLVSHALRFPRGRLVKVEHGYGICEKPVHGIVSCGVVGR
jgi:hypothetical protein